MNFTLNRTYTHASKLGHSVEFVKGVSTYVPPALHTEVQGIGAIPDEELPPDENKLPTVPSDPEKRAVEILAAMQLLADRNSREDFTASGAPALPVLSSVVGWKVDAKERDTLWARFQVDGVS